MLNMVVLIAFFIAYSRVQLLVLCSACSLCTSIFFKPSIKKVDYGCFLSNIFVSLWCFHVPD